MILSWFAIVFIHTLAYLQPAPILLLNPSFEDIPWHSKPPRGWYYCGQPGESPPDVHPTGYFEVDQPPAHGDTYVGMVVRDNATWEAIGQRLPKPLEAGHCYRFNLQACRSPYYRSVSRLTGQRAYYIDPVRIRLWGGDANCDHAELLAASGLVTDTAWTNIEFELHPQQSHHYFIIEAFYPEDTAKVYRGNVLIDQCSPILPADCRTRQLLVEPERQHFPVPATVPELTDLISRLTTDINFGFGTAELTNQYYLNPAGRPVQENLALHKLVKAVRSHPTAELEIAVKAPGKFLREERLYVLEKKLQKMGLSEHQFRLHHFRKSDVREEWLGINKDQDVYIRLR